MIKKLPLLAAGALAIFGIAVSLHGVPAKIIFVSASSLIVTAASWRWMLSTREKIALLGGLRGARAYN